MSELPEIEYSEGAQIEINNLRNEVEQLQNLVPQLNDVMKDILGIVEAKRRKVLKNRNDPSWTEHFAELENEIQAYFNNRFPKSPKDILGKTDINPYGDQQNYSTKIIAYSSKDENPYGHMISDRELTQEEKDYGEKVYKKAVKDGIIPKENKDES